MTHHGLGRIHIPDARDNNYPMTAAIPAATTRTYRYWYDGGWWGDQGQNPFCVAYSWTHWIEDSPNPREGLTGDTYCEALYRDAQKVDEWPGENYDGTSVRAGAKVLAARGLISGYWAWDIETVVRAILTSGPVVVGTSWYCVTPGTRILTTDLKWVTAEKISEGDEIIGFDEQANRSSCYRRAVVVANPLIVRPVVEVVTDQGSISVSVEHQFVQTFKKLARAWTRADQLKPGDTIAYMGEPWEVDRSWEAGWLSGFYDGEGTMSQSVDGSRNGNVLSCSQKIGPELERALSILGEKGFAYTTHLRPAHGNDQALMRWNLKGRNVRMRFLGSIRPERLLSKSHTLWEGYRTWNRKASAAIVQDVRHLGNQEVYAVSTSTRTLITDGYLSHNSGMFTPSTSGRLKVTGDVAGGHAYVLNGVNTKTGLIRIKNSWSRNWGADGHAYIALGDFEKLLAEDGEAAMAVKE